MDALPAEIMDMICTQKDPKGNFILTPKEIGGLRTVNRQIHHTTSEVYKKRAFVSLTCNVSITSLKHLVEVANDSKLAILVEELIVDPEPMARGERVEDYLVAKAYLDPDATKAFQLLSMALAKFLNLKLVVIATHQQEVLEHCGLDGYKISGFRSYILYKVYGLQTIPAVDNEKETWYLDDEDVAFYEATDYMRQEEEDNTRLGQICVADVDWYVSKLRFNGYTTVPQRQIGIVFKALCTILDRPEWSLDYCQNYYLFADWRKWTYEFDIPTDEDCDKVCKRGKQLQLTGNGQRSLAELVGRLENVESLVFQGEKEGYRFTQAKLKFVKKLILRNFTVWDTWFKHILSKTAETLQDIELNTVRTSNGDWKTMIQDLRELPGLKRLLLSDLKEVWYESDFPAESTPDVAELKLALVGYSTTIELHGTDIESFLALTEQNIDTRHAFVEDRAAVTSTVQCRMVPRMLTIVDEHGFLYSEGFPKHDQDDTLWLLSQLWFKA
ncbi:hypothetical protein BDV96DRAFT_599748 [Lophiotrema nucula]|uniref:Uncharacterized protein n=1 Tax=Lophiotrema nucula TaxID=690887 RepID=A0A6A5Z915_9PLEO|nr:hypothetical protein BDV96DRAFT_599748 [Lophiotrema nucula]